MLISIIVTSCGELSDQVGGVNAHKRRTPANPLKDWRRIQAQDLAILLPKSAEYRIAMNSLGPSGQTIFPTRWLDQVSEVFSVTDVRGALSTENTISDWQVVSIRVSPCSPLGTKAGPESSQLCWPEIRVVWQPVLFDYNLGWTWVDAFADDRAIHALHRYYPQGNHKRARRLIREMTHMLGSNRKPTESLWTEFNQLRNEAISNLLGEILKLRSASVKEHELSTLDMRTETQKSTDEEKAFILRLLSFLEFNAPSETLHTLTAFSLPPGRDPEGINSWVFLAFSVHQGELIRQDIQVFNPDNGEVLVTLTHNETVAAASADPEVAEWLKSDSALADTLSQRVLLDEYDRDRLAPIINDPQQTLVANTTCSTCHSLNEDTFNFHNLSYLKDGGLTISDRVVNDVQHELRWLSKYR